MFNDITFDIKTKQFPSWLRFSYITPQREEIIITSPLDFFRLYKQRGEYDSIFEALNRSVEHVKTRL